MADVKITITIPEAQIKRVQKILQIYPIPEGSGHTQKEWFKILLTRYIKGLVKQVERTGAEQTARDNVSDVDVME
jgi:hypothetical protein